MTHSLVRAAALGLSLVCAAMPAIAHDHRAGTLSVSDAWGRPTLPGRPTAVYALIANAGTEDDRLVAASSPAFAAVELHTTIMQGDIMQMQQVEAIEVPAGGLAELKPGGFHVMLFGAVSPLAQGDSFALMLEFEHAGTVEIAVPVQKRAGGMGDHGGGHGAGHGTSHGTTD